MMTTNNIKALFVAVIVTIISACNNSNTAADKKPVHTDSNAVAVYTFPVEHGYGYSIFVNDKAFINQDCIPVIQGNKPFASKEDAKKTGELVAQKIRTNQIPTLTVQELNKLGIAMQ